MIQIEKNISVPAAQNVGRPRIYPFAEMEIGDSFLLPTAEKDRVGQAAKAWKARHGGWNYRTRVLDEGIRIWRVS